MRLTQLTHHDGWLSASLSDLWRESANVIEAWFPEAQTHDEDDTMSIEHGHS